MNGSRFSLAIVLPVLAVILALEVWAPLPEPLTENAPANEFSAARALAELRTLLGDQTPHPVGSPANDRVRERLMNRLRELGLPPETQTAIGCNGRWSACGRVVNVLARIPGVEDAGIALMAHYDSVPFAPGAGDDGAAVAALLEIARILEAEAPHPYSLMFVFTDGEEAGLLGAEAFFAEHPWAHLAKTVINMEGSGSGGPVFLLRAGPRSGNLVQAYRSVAAHPAAASFAEEIFKRMPNDTDFSVSMRADIPGIDFAFAGERNHYHTPLDSIEMLEPATLQHHGENVLPLVRRLLAADLDATSPNIVFTTLPGSWWLTWTPATGIVLAGVALALLAVATWRARAVVGALKVLGGVGVALAVIVSIVVVELAALWAADQLAGTRVAWPASSWPWRLVIWGGVLLGAALAAPPLVRRLGVMPTLFGAWWLWALLALLLAVTAPMAANLLLPATLLASALLLLLGFVGARADSITSDIVTIVAAAGAGVVLLGLAYNGEITQGLGLAAVTFVPLALVAVTVTPLFAAPAGTRLVRAASLVAVVAGLAWCAFIPLYSELRPQHLSFQYVHNADAGSARLVASSPNPVPQRVHDVLELVPADSPVVPWGNTGRPEPPSAGLAMLPVHPPQLTALPTGGDAAGTRRVVVRSQRSARTLALHVPISAKLEALEVNGRSVGLETRPGDEYVSLHLVNPPPEGFVVEARFAGTEPVEVYVADMVSSLPTLANDVVEARGPLAVPAHFGDAWVVYRRVTI